MTRVPPGATASSTARWISSGPPTTGPTARTEAWIITIWAGARPRLRRSCTSDVLVEGMREYYASSLRIGMSEFGGNSVGADAGTLSLDARALPRQRRCCIHRLTGIEMHALAVDWLRRAG